MANVKISALPAVTSLNSTDVLPSVAGTSTSKITVQNLANSLTQVSSSITANTASFVTASNVAGPLGFNSVLSASYAVTASYALNGGGGGSPFPYTGSAKITGSLTVDGPVKVTGSIDTSAGVRLVDGIYIKDSGGGYNNYFALDVNDNLQIPSYAAGGYGLKIVDGGGNLFANFFGNGSNSQFIFTGSAKINGNLNLVNGGVTSSLFGTSSWALNAVSASYATTSSFTFSSSFAQTASYVNPLVQNVSITGSLVVSGANGAGVFSQGATLVDYIDGISNSGSYMVWRAPFSCSVVALHGYYVGGSNIQVNAARSGSSGYGRITGSNLVLTSANTWFSAIPGGLQNVNFNAGDSLQVIMSGSANNQIAVQVDLIRKF